MSHRVQAIAIEELAALAEEIGTSVRAGQTLMLTQDGVRITEIVPRPPELTGEQREAAWQEIKALMDEGLDWGGPYSYEDRHG